MYAALSALKLFVKTVRNKSLIPKNFIIRWIRENEIEDQSINPRREVTRAVSEI